MMVTQRNCMGGAMAEDDVAAGLTRALLLGVSLGTVALTQVGCEPAVAPRAAAGAGPDAAPEAALCERALETSDPRDVEALLVAHPRGDCVIPTLAALPPQTLPAISPAVLARLPTSVRDRIPPRVAARLRMPLESRTSDREEAGGGGPY